MKYIRTDCAIYKIVRIDREKNPAWYLIVDTPSYSNYVSEDGVIKQADNIEELCDACVVKLKYEKQSFIGSFYEFEHFISQYVKKIPSNNPVTDIFGAIWTDKGLIYVAKMNKEGKFELICE